MEKLDIDWLHKEGKEGRRSGRTTEMLANAVGVALVADKDSEIYIICAPGSEARTADLFFETFQAIAKWSTYYTGNYYGKHHFISRRSDVEIKITVQTNRVTEQTVNGNKRDVYEFVDHYFEEYERQMKNHRKYIWNEPRGYKMGRGRYGLGW